MSEKDDQIIDASYIQGQVTALMLFLVFLLRETVSVKPHSITLFKELIRRDPDTGNPNFNRGKHAMHETMMNVLNLLVERDAKN